MENSSLKDGFIQEAKGEKAKCSLAKWLGGAVLAASLSVLLMQKVQSQEVVAFNDNAKKQELVETKAKDPSVLTQAGDYAENNSAVAIYVSKGPENQDEFEAFQDALSVKLNEKGVKHKFFVFKNDKPGAAFVYIIGKRANGPMEFDTFVAFLPEMVRDYRAAYPTARAENTFRLVNN